MLMDWARKHRATILWSVGLLWALWLFISSRSFFQECIQAQQNADAENAFYESVSNLLIALGVLRGCTGHFIHENGDAITALATVLLALITYLLVRLGHEQSNTTRAQLRAYLSVLPQGGCIIDNTVGKLRFFIDASNVGQTPSFNTEFMWGIQVRPKKAGFIRIEADKEALKPSSVMYPGATHALGKPVQLTDDEIASITADTHAIFIFGQVTFLDAFGRKQYAAFNSFLDKEGFDNFLATAGGAGHGAKVKAAFKFAYSFNHASMEEADWDAASGIAPIDPPDLKKGNKKN